MNFEQPLPSRSFHVKICQINTILHYWQCANFVSTIYNNTLLEMYIMRVKYITYQSKNFKKRRKNRGYHDHKPIVKQAKLSWLKKNLLKSHPREMRTRTYPTRNREKLKKKCNKWRPPRQRRHAVKFCNLRKLLAQRSVDNLLGPGVDPGVVVVVRVGREPARPVPRPLESG